jgi:hypothetical protein
LPTAIPTCVAEDWPTARRLENKLALIEAALDEAAVSECALARQVVENKAAPIESAFDELATPKRGAAERTAVELGLRDHGCIEQSPIPLQALEPAPQQSSVDTLAVDRKVFEFTEPKHGLAPNRRYRLRREGCFFHKHGVTATSWSDQFAVSKLIEPAAF